jgi:hypothetical protein
MLREIEVRFWVETYDIEDLIKPQERKRNEIFKILQNSVGGSKRSSTIIRKRLCLG